MGNWNMTITGVGAHHNYKRDEKGNSVYNEETKDYERNIDYDADLLFKEFVAKLRAKGHQIQHASFTHGARETVHGPRDGEWPLFEGHVLKE